MEGMEDGLLPAPPGIAGLPTVPAGGVPAGRQAPGPEPGSLEGVPGPGPNGKGGFGAAPPGPPPGGGRGPDGPPAGGGPAGGRMIRVRIGAPEDSPPGVPPPKGPNSCSKNFSGVSAGAASEAEGEEVVEGVDVAPLAPSCSLLLGRMVGMTAEGRTTRMRLRCMVGQISKARSRASWAARPVMGTIRTLPPRLASAPASAVSPIFSSSSLICSNCD